MPQHSNLAKLLPNRYNTRQCADALNDISTRVSILSVYLSCYDDQVD